VADEISAQEIKPHLIHETVVAELAWLRSGTAKAKSRAEVRGGGSKPWRQKGTGRARQGSIRAPQWTGGGVVFGPTPRSYGGKVNRKVRRQALLGALRAHLERASIAVMDELGWDGPSTKSAAAYLDAAPERFGDRPLAVVVSEAEGPEARSFRNIRGVDVVEASELSTVHLTSFRSLVVQRSAWEQLWGELGAAGTADTAGPTAGEALAARERAARRGVATPAEDASTAEAEPAAEEEAPAEKPAAKKSAAKKSAAKKATPKKAAGETSSEEGDTPDAEDEAAEKKPARKRAKKAEPAAESGEEAAPEAEEAAAADSETSEPDAEPAAEQQAEPATDDDDQEGSA
jgi:large subunit ribosomal protein L4